MESPFKKSSLNEMCKQIKSVPVIFKMKDGTNCLAFYNNENFIQATKLYILFPDSTTPKYIENNNLYSMRGCIIHGLSKEIAVSLYNKVNKLHKPNTINCIMELIDKLSSPVSQDVDIKEPITATKDYHVSYNRKHACGWVMYKGHKHYCLMKDLKDKHVEEIIIGDKVDYDITLSSVLWTASISSRDFTSLKIKIRDIKNA